MANIANNVTETVGRTPLVRINRMAGELSLIHISEPTRPAA